MEINPTRPELNRETQRSNLTGSEDTASDGTKKPGRGLADSVSVTNQAVLLRKLEQSLASIPEIDNPRVQAIKQSLADGSYIIDSEQLVNNLLSSEQDFT